MTNDHTVATTCVDPWRSPKSTAPSISGYSVNPNRQSGLVGVQLLTSFNKAPSRSPEYAFTLILGFASLMILPPRIVNLQSESFGLQPVASWRSMGPVPL